MRHKKNKWAAFTRQQLRTRRAALARQLPNVEATLRGSLQHQSRRCGKAGCRCNAGELHGPYMYLSVRTTRTRSRLLYIPADAAEEVSRRIETTGRIETALAEISAINLELLARGELT
jgi:hypothetical protein